MKQPNLSIYRQACSLYEAIGSDPENSELIDNFNKLVEEYNFDNEIIKEEEGKYGVNLCTGESIIPPEYDRLKMVSLFGIPRDSIMAVGVRDKKEYLIDGKGKEIFSADEIKPLTSLIIPFAFRLGDRWGVATMGGAIVIPPVMDKIEGDVNGYIFFRQGGRWGLRTSLGEMVRPQFDNIEWDENEYLMVTMNGEKGYLDVNCAFTIDQEEAFYHSETGI